MNTDKWEVRKSLALLIAYQIANITMILGFFFIVFLALHKLGVF